MSILTKEERRTVRAKYEASTPGRWYAEGGMVCSETHQYIIDCDPECPDCAREYRDCDCDDPDGDEPTLHVARSNARFISAAHALLPRALDTIDALEAERDALHEKMSTIGAFAHFNHDTRTIGGAHAALREILSVIEGVDVEEDRPQACLKCTGTGFIQAPCTDPAHRHGHVECKSCPGGWGLTAQKCDECCVDEEGDQ